MPLKKHTTVVGIKWRQDKDNLAFYRGPIYFLANDPKCSRRGNFGMFDGEKVTTSGNTLEVNYDAITDWLPFEDVANLLPIDVQDLN